MNKASLHVLAIEPYYGGSHRAFLDGVVRYSRHQWTRLTGPARHWKWRMRVAPLSLARQVIDRLDEFAQDGKLPDVVLCSEMLDLPQWRGFLLSQTQRLPRDDVKAAGILQQIASLPTVCYFHENQWTYPVAPQAREDAHYGYTNLLTALAADEVWFNSDFHRREFLEAARKFVARMPDDRAVHDLDRLAQISRVVPPGFEPVPVGDMTINSKALKIGWVARWEHDKRPDRFERLLEILDDQRLNFELILLGTRPRNAAAALTRIEQRWSQRIHFSGFAESAVAYHAYLRQMDVVVSTADHEFFGIAICEAVSAGAIPVVPNALSYSELLPASVRYESLQEAAQLVLRIGQMSSGDRAKLRQRCRESIWPYRIEHGCRLIDRYLSQLRSGENDQRERGERNLGSGERVR